MQRHFFSPQFLRFCIVGATGTIIDFLLFWWLVYVLGVHYFLAGLLTFLVAVSWNFYWNRRYTFRSFRRNIWEQFHDYFTIAVIGVLLHLGVLSMLVEWSFWDPLLSKVVATAVVIVWNYLGNKLLTFAETSFEAVLTKHDLSFSIVIPCYNEVLRVGATLSEIETYVSEKGLAVEVIVVDDGSTDGTGDFVRGLLAASSLPHRVLSLPRNMGKGKAVQTGVAAAQGMYTLVMDADHSTHIRELEKLVPHLEQSPTALLIGSRYVEEGSIHTKQSVLRQWISRAGNVAIQLLLLPTIRDSQCGFKLFPTHTAQMLFASLRSYGFSYDFEILARAKRWGIPVIEVPIVWNNHKESKVRLLLDPLRMLWDLLRVKVGLLLEKRS